MECFLLTCDECFFFSELDVDSCLEIVTLIFMRLFKYIHIYFFSLCSLLFFLVLVQNECDLAFYYLEDNIT